MRDRQPERLRRLEVDDQLELGGLLDGQVGGLRALENLIRVDGCLPELGRKVRPTGHEAPGLRLLPVPIHRRQPVLYREIGEPCPVARKHRVSHDEKGPRTLPGHRREGAVELPEAARL